MLITMETDTSFATWLKDVLKEKGMKPYDLTKKANLGPGTLYDLFSGRRKAGVDLITAIADGLDVPREVALRAAGILPRSKKANETVEQIIHELEGMTKDEQQEYLSYIRWMNNKKKK